MVRHMLTGELLRKDGISEGCIEVVDGIITDVFDGPLPNRSDGHIVHEGLIVPGLIDMHTHLGDHGARGDLPPHLEDAVFPGGVKSRFLEKTTKAGLVRSIAASLEELRPGVTRILDFREGGLKGLEALQGAVGKGGPVVHALGRPTSGEDPMAVLQNSAGFGLPCLEPGLEGLRSMARKHGKVFSLHVSELFRDDMDRALDLGPDLMVHMVAGTSDEWAALSDEGIPVAVCPRSNSAFSIDVPLKAMMDSGLMMGLGTDNSMNVRQDMFREMEQAWMLLRKCRVPGSEASSAVFRMAVGASMEGSALWERLPRSTYWWEPDWPKVGGPAHLSVMRMPKNDRGKDPIDWIVRFGHQGSVLFTCP